MSPQLQIQRQSDIQEKKKLILKLFIRLLLYINEKNNNKKTNDDTISEEHLNSFLEYLQNLATSNKDNNNESDYKNKAFDEINVEVITKQRLELFKKQKPEAEGEGEKPTTTDT